MKEQSKVSKLLVAIGLLNVSVWMELF